MSGLEIELKAGLSPADARRLQQRLEADVGAGQGPVRLQTRYFDLLDDSLARAGYALRIRLENGRRTQTVKAGRRMVGGFHQVREFDAPLKGTKPRLEAVADRHVRTALEKLTGGAPLVARHETRVARTRWQVQAPGGLVEVAIDRGRIVADGASLPVLEVEFELLGGSPAALFELATRYLGDSDAWLGIPNKAARGAALARGETPGPAVVASKPEAPEKGMAASAAFEAGLQQLTAAIAANLHMVLTSDAPEGPHQLRVSLRRLRVLLKLHRHGLQKKLARKLGDEARRLGQIISPLRDADVLVPAILAEAGEAAPALQPPLARMLARERVVTRRNLRAANASGFALRLMELAALGGWRQNADDTPVETRGARYLQDLWADIYPRADALAWLPAEDRHELRKLLKKLRYTLELMPKTRAKAFMSQLKKLQDDLGELNDLSVLSHWDPPLRDAEVTGRFRALQASRRAASKRRADQAMGRACRHWLALRACALPWHPWQRTPNH